jgi:hypothetical protein
MSTSSPPFRLKLAHQYQQTYGELCHPRIVKVFEGLLCDDT